MLSHDTIATIEQAALALRAQLWPGLSIFDAPPVADLAHRSFQCAGLTVRVRGHSCLPDTCFGLTTVRMADMRASIWLNHAAWPELLASIPRTRFTISHELGHVVLHAAEIGGLDAVAERDHDRRLEAEANRFAGHFLVPDEALAAAGADPHTLAARYCLTIGAAHRRLSERQ